MHHNTLFVGQDTTHSIRHVELSYWDEFNCVICIWNQISKIWLSYENCNCEMLLRYYWKYSKKLWELNKTSHRGYVLYSFGEAYSKRLNKKYLIAMITYFGLSRVLLCLISGRIFFKFIQPLKGVELYILFIGFFNIYKLK